MNADTKMILEEMRANNTAIFGVLGEMNKRFDSMDTRFDGIDTRLDGIDTRLEGIDNRLDSMDIRFDGIDTRLDGIDTRIDGIDTRLDNVEYDIRGIKVVIENEIRRDINIIIEGHLDLSRGIDELRERDNKNEQLAIDVLWLKNKVGAM